MMITCLIGEAVGMRSTLLSGSGSACAGAMQANAQVNAARLAAVRRGRLADAVIGCSRFDFWNPSPQRPRTLVALHDGRVSVLCKSGTFCGIFGRRRARKW